MTNSVEYIAVLAKNWRTNETAKLVYNFVPCDCRVMNDFANYIGGRPNDWAITKVGVLSRRRIGYRDYRYKDYSPLDKQ